MDLHAHIFTSKKNTREQCFQYHSSGYGWEGKMAEGRKNRGWVVSIYINSGASMGNANTF